MSGEKESGRGGERERRGVDVSGGRGCVGEMVREGEWEGCSERRRVGGRERESSGERVRVRGCVWKR